MSKKDKQLVAPHVDPAVEPTVEPTVQPRKEHQSKWTYDFELQTATLAYKDGRPSVEVRLGDFPEDMLGKLALHGITAKVGSGERIHANIAMLMDGKLKSGHRASLGYRESTAEQFSAILAAINAENGGPAHKDVEYFRAAYVAGVKDKAKAALFAKIKGDIQYQTRLSTMFPDASHRVGVSIQDAVAGV